MELSTDDLTYRNALARDIYEKAALPYIERFDPDESKLRKLAQEAFQAANIFMEVCGEEGCKGTR